MVYLKQNVPAFERLVRIVAGFGLAGAGIFWSMGNGTVWLAGLAVASGIIAAGTGFVGFCPMCALAGRRWLGARQ